MWVLRRASNPLRGHVYCSGASRRASSAMPDRLLNNLEHGVGHHEDERPVSHGYLHPKRFYQRHSDTTKLFVGMQGLSSQAGTKSGDDEDDLEDGFSELETPPSTEIVGEDNANEENVEELISEPEVSDTDSEDDMSEQELDLSDVEPVAKDDKLSQKKKLTSPLFKLIIHSQRQSIHSVLDKWVKEGNTLGRTEFSFSMLNLRKRRIYGKALQLSEWVEAKKQIDFVERDYASRLDLIGKVRGPSKAESYIEKIPLSFQGEIVYRTLLANYVSSMSVKKAEEVFNKMRDLGFPLTAFSCNQLLLLYKRVDRKKIADVLLLMEKENVKPTLLTYRLLIDTKGRSNDITGMEQVIETMKADGLEPDLLTQEMVARYYVFGGLHEKAEAVLKEMEGGDIKENRGACRHILPLYASLHKADDVDRIWKVCESKPRLGECFVAVEAYGKVGQVENAEAVFEKMLKTKKFLSEKFYSALLKVYANHKLLSKGTALAKRMSDNGCQIGPYTWDALVKLHLEAGEVGKADSILQKAAQQNTTRPFYNSYLAVLEKYAKRGDIHNAEKIFHRLRQSGYVGRMMQYQVLLQAYANAKAPAYGFMERLKADNIFPNKAVTTLLAQVDAFRKTAISDLLD